MQRPFESDRTDFLGTHCFQDRGAKNPPNVTHTCRPKNGLWRSRKPPLLWRNLFFLDFRFLMEVYKRRDLGKRCPNAMLLSVGRILANLLHFWCLYQFSFTLVLLLVGCVRVFFLYVLFLFRFYLVAFG